MSLIYLMGRVGAILVHSQINPFLVVLGGVYLGNMFLMSWRMSPIGEKSLPRCVRPAFLVHGDKHSTFLGHFAD